MSLISVKHVSKQITAFFSPKIIAEVNDQYVKIAKIKGDDLPWHTHSHEDELFYIVKGKLTMYIKGKAPFKMRKGDVYVVPKGIEHKVSAKKTCVVMLVETKTTKHTGDVVSEITRSISEQK